ncbi:hypothetical protein ACFQ68_37380 [Amycolatopsis japonica]|uniref:hypothetical protein n=1 Tax=Amycolatopsis japonica TaxID=208439 RepID=UPI00366F5D8A
MGDARIRLQPLSNLHAAREVHVGWDQALQTYYAHVYNGVDAAGRENFALKIGTTIEEISDPHVVVDAVSAYAAVPTELDHLLDVGRRLPNATMTDLREYSRLYQNEQRYYDKMNELYRPGGFATQLSHEQVNPILAEHGWVMSEVSLINGGHSETYVRNGHELTIPWGWPDSRHGNEQLLSPVIADGQRYGVSTPEALAKTLAHVRNTPPRDLQGEHEAVDENDLMERDIALREEPPGDDLSFGSGSGY